MLITRGMGTRTERGRAAGAGQRRGEDTDDLRTRPGARGAGLAKRALPHARAPQSSDTGRAGVSSERSRAPGG